MNTQQGFTLMELMIVVAILGIVASIAIPTYQNFTAKVQATSALSEITQGKTKATTLIQDGLTANITTPDEIGLLSPSIRCSLVKVSILSADGSGTITCTIAGSPNINNKTITLTRTTAAVWSCASTVLSIHKPKDCS